MADECTYSCSLCSMQSPSLSHWMSHIGLVHASDDISMPCLIRGCNAVYSRANSVSSHIYRKHRKSIIHLSNSADGIVSPSDNRQESSTPVTPMDLSLPGDIRHHIDILLDRSENEHKKSCLFLMHLKKERMITRAAVQHLTAGCKEVFEHTVGHLKAAISHKLCDSGFDTSEELGCIVCQYKTTASA